jgi:hypothetical protein
MLISDTFYSESLAMRVYLSAKAMQSTLLGNVKIACIGDVNVGAMCTPAVTTKAIGRQYYWSIVSEYSYYDNDTGKGAQGKSKSRLEPNLAGLAGREAHRSIPSPDPGRKQKYSSSS